MARKPKFKVGQIVLNRYYKDDYIQIHKKKFGAALNNSKVWAYSPSRSNFNPVWIEETMLRALTRRERGA